MVEVSDRPVAHRYAGKFVDVGTTVKIVDPKDVEFTVVPSISKWPIQTVKGGVEPREVIFRGAEETGGDGSGYGRVGYKFTLEEDGVETTYKMGTVYFVLGSLATGGYRRKSRRHRAKKSRKGKSRKH